MMQRILLGLGASFFLFFSACTPNTSEESIPAWDGATLFERLAPAATGVDFANTLEYEEAFNIYKYRNFYNGGGVALGDVNNDGLTDIYFSGNRVENRLYLNRGDFEFEDVTEAAGVAGQAAWSTGVTMVDINADGFLDIYLCNSGDIVGDNRRNELYINNQDGTFSEAAEAYGLANEGLSTHAVFFDYDRDGDLDCYLLNNSYQAIGSFNLERNERPKRDEKGGDILYRNDGGKFVDVSEAANIYGSIIGFGLGVTVGDVDRDGWLDIYVSNDFFERDYLYMNQGDGTFKETLTEAMTSISAASMGADMADINNDGYGEIFVTEMLPATNARLKTATTFENWNKYQFNLQNDYYHQFTRNMLQRNNGDGTYTEIGRLAGVEATDWSWGALIFDFENDGYKDLFVANGIYQDLTNRDFLDYIADDEFKKEVTATGKVDFKKLVDAIPSNPVTNAAFRNEGPTGDYNFADVAQAYGLDLLGFSNGSAYGDLDNDGDLDLVINNVNRKATLYRNHANGTDNNWLQVKPRSKGNNTFAVGTKVTLHAGEDAFYLEHMPMRGFQSSMDYRMHFGLGKNNRIDSLVIEWPDGQQETLVDVETNQVLSLDYQEQGATPLSKTPVAAAGKPIFKQYPDTYTLYQDNTHQENRYSDFDRDPLLYHMLSAEGPALCAGAFGPTGELGFYLGGAKGQAGKLNVQTRKYFAQKAESVLQADAISEDVACTCFDANGDGRTDVYVVSGSSEFGAAAPALLDRLYLNQENQWVKSAQILPNGRRPAVGSVAKHYDVDGDGDEDLFVGSRLRAGLYGTPADSYLLLNDGQGNFTDAEEAALQELGMITDARWVDITGDDAKELVVVGEWMTPKAFAYQEGKLAEVAMTFRASTLVQGEEKTAKLNGWYTALEAADLNADGRMDLILGNHGLNSRFRASEAEPVILHVNDFDQNGKAEQIISTYEAGKAYPMPLLHDLVKQMPGLRKRYLKYSSFGDQTMQDIFSDEVLERSVKLEATEFRSLVALNQGEGNFKVIYLPAVAQETPMHAILADDVDRDGDIDLLTGGNFYYAKPETGRYDAGRGLLLLNDGKGNLNPVSATESGINIAGEIRDIVGLGRGLYLFGRNNLPPVIIAREAE
ncbi:MAG: VCBS repeat-containing protein [Bacteroidota bacterium]